MPNTTNFNWNTPADTDLVKDGAAAIRTLGNNIDASLVDLKGGTTGQVLAKATNTDLDFTWVAQDDSNAIQNAIVDAKGDLITATAADTPARLASSGVNGDVLTVDTSTSTGLKWAAVSAGGWTQLATGTLSGTTNLTGIASGYRQLVLVLRDIRTSGSNDVPLRINNDSTASAYLRLSHWVWTANSTLTSSGRTGNNLPFGINGFGSTGNDQFAVITLTDYDNTTSWKLIEIRAITFDGTDRYLENITGAWLNTAAINEINLVQSNLNQGSYFLYGVK